MVSIRDINRQARQKALGGAKMPHGISWPVLHKHDRGLTIAYYVTVHNHGDLESGIFRRPTEWLEFDIREGKMIGRYDCRINDFSKEPMDGKYDLSQGAEKKPDAETMERLYREFDSVRESLFTHGMPDMGLYIRYKREVLSMIPAAYQVFLKELSI